MGFLRKVVRQNGTNVMSFGKQFEKVGPGLLREAFWREGECFVSQKRWEKKERISPRKLSKHNTQLDTLHSFLFIQMASVFTAFLGPILSYFPPLFRLTTNWKASGNNPFPTFSNCTQNDVTLVPFCLTTSSKKTIVYYCQWFPTIALGEKGVPQMLI